MVVVIILAVLLAIAVPSYLGARSRAADLEARRSVRTAFIALQNELLGSEVIPAVALGSLGDIEGISVQTSEGGASTGPTDIAWRVEGGRALLAVRSTTGLCLGMQQESAVNPYTIATGGLCAAAAPGEMAIVTAPTDPTDTTDTTTETVGTTPALEQGTTTTVAETTATTTAPTSTTVKKKCPVRNPNC